MRLRIARALGTFLAVLVLAACAPGAPHDVIDPSAPELVRSLGEDNGLVLSEVAGAIPLGRGRIAIADGSTGRILIVERDGTVSSAGGAGEGPGEFRTLAWLGRWGQDTIVAFDASLRRLSALDAEGNFLQSWAADEIAGLEFPRVRGTLETGELLVEADAPGGTIVDEAEDVRRFPARLLTATRGGAAGVVAVNEIAGSQRYVSSGSGGRTIQLPVVWGYSLHFTGGGDRLWWGYSGDPSVHFASLTGAKGLLDLPTTQHPVSAAMREQEIQEMTETASGGVRPQLLQMLRDAPANSATPAFYDLLADQSGLLWVRVDRTEDPAQWFVVDTAGVVGARHFPGGFTPTYIAEGSIVGIFQDELGVESVRVYADSEPLSASSP